MRPTDIDYLIKTLVGAGADLPSVIELFFSQSSKPDWDTDLQHLINSWPGRNVNLRIGPENDTLLILAKRKNYLALFQLLLKLGADPNLVNNKGEKASDIDPFKIG